MAFGLQSIRRHLQRGLRWSRRFVLELLELSQPKRLGVLPPLQYPGTTFCGCCWSFATVVLLLVVCNCRFPTGRLQLSFCGCCWSSSKIRVPFTRAASQVLCCADISQPKPTETLHVSGCRASAAVNTAGSTRHPPVGSTLSAANRASSCLQAARMGSKRQSNRASARRVMLQ